jgi:hypothetical protein
MNKQEALVGQFWQDKARVLQDKPISVPLHPPQILNRVAWDRSQTSTVGSQQITAWPMAQSGKIYAVPWHNVQKAIQEDDSWFEHCIKNRGYLTVNKWKVLLCQPSCCKGFEAVQARNIQYMIFIQFGRQAAIWRCKSFVMCCSVHSTAQPQISHATIDIYLLVVYLTIWRLTATLVVVLHR